jgi:hypothetical protein
MKAKYLPGVVRAEYVKDYVLDITFSDGTEKLIDISQWFRGPIFEPLRNKTYFRKFFIEGATVGWPNGADIAPETLYDAPAATKTKTRPRRAKVARRT